MILFAAGLFVGAADTIPTKELLNNKLRRSLHYIVVNCVKFENNTCECPGGCMSYNENRSNPKCVLNNCWEWDIDKTECVENGPSFISAIVLQAIPFTGVFGGRIWKYGTMGFVRGCICYMFWSTVDFASMDMLFGFHVFKKQ
jgi:hypothetical protein